MQCFRTARGVNFTLGTVYRYLEYFPFQVIPPKEWIPRRSYEDVDITIPAPILQVVTGTQGKQTELTLNGKRKCLKRPRKLLVKIELQQHQHIKLSLYTGKCLVQSGKK